MPFTIHKEIKGQRWFKLKETLHITRDGRAVKENDPDGVRVLGSAGGLVSEEDARKYKLDASQIESDSDAYVPPAATEAIFTAIKFAVEALGADPSADQEQAAEDLESKTKAELLALANEKEIEAKPSMKKADIIEAIEGAK